MILTFLKTLKRRDRKNTEENKRRRRDIRRHMAKAVEFVALASAKRD
jgi:hypothetical protein